MLNWIEGLFRQSKPHVELDTLPPEVFELRTVRSRAYKPFDSVTREVFCSWLLQSFAESRGNLPLQADYITLVGLNTNLDVRRSIQNFAYGTNHVFMPWQRLTSREQRAMTDGYMRLMKTRISHMQLIEEPYHKCPFVHERINLGERFNVQIKHVIARLDPKCVNLIPVSRGMDIHEFRAQVQPHLKVYQRN